VNAIYHDTVAIAIAEDNDLDPEKAFSGLVKILYSDDNISENSYLGKLWTVANFSTYMFKFYGIDVTMTDKSDVSGASSSYSIDDVDFLSRKFERRGGIVYAPLHPESLFSQLYFVKLPKNKRTMSNMISQLQINLDNVSRELVEYEPAKAKHYATLIMQAIIRFKIPCYLPQVDYDDGHLLKMAYY
jgi:hypothetical protein